MCKVIVCFGVLVYISAAAASTGDHMEWWEYWKLCSLANELAVEAKNRIQQTDNIRDMLAAETGFQIGVIMGKIRDKYRSMLELYRMTSNKHVLDPDITLPAMTPIKPLYYIVRMEMIHALEVEIDGLVRVLEALPPRDLEPSMTYMKFINEEQMKMEKERERFNPDVNTDDPARIEERIKEDNKEKYLRTHQQQNQFALY